MALLTSSVASFSSSHLDRLDIVTGILTGENDDGARFEDADGIIDRESEDRHIGGLLDERDDLEVACSYLTPARTLSGKVSRHRSEISYSRRGPGAKVARRNFNRADRAAAKYMLRAEY